MLRDKTMIKKKETVSPSIHQLCNLLITENVVVDRSTSSLRQPKHKTTLKATKFEKIKNRTKKNNVYAYFSLVSNTCFCVIT